MKLLVLCPYPVDCAPSQRFKFEQYYASWRGAGWDVDVRSFWDEAGWDVLYARGSSWRKSVALLRGLGRRIRDLRAAREADLVYLHLEAVPVGPPWIERILARARVPIVYDLDDLIQLPHSSRANPFMRWLRRPGKVSELMRIADHVVVCTEYLAEIARRENASVTNISSTIDTDRYRPSQTRDRTERVVVGWSGSHSTAPYLHLLDDVLRELQRSEGIAVKVIGDASFSVPGLEIDARAWRSESEVEDLGQIDIGVYPLPHEEWVLGKSGLKLLQYMGMGIPAVAERVGANTEIVEHGVNGLLASGPDEWLACLRSLVSDPEGRARLGRAGRRTVEERYSVEATSSSYLAVLADAFSSRTS